MFNFKTKNKLKSQVPVDFLLSLVIFIVSLLIISHSLMLNLFENREDREREKFLLIGFTISELLIYDRGYPIDWNNIYNARRLGFADDFYKLSRDKILAINNCNTDDYNRIKYLLSIPSEMDIEIIIKKTNEEILARCGKYYAYRRFTEIRRISSLDNDVVLLIVRVYR